MIVCENSSDVMEGIERERKPRRRMKTVELRLT